MQSASPANIECRKLSGDSVHRVQMADIVATLCGETAYVGYGDANKALGDTDTSPMISAVAMH